MDLLRDLIRARTLERFLGRIRTGDPSSVRPVSPGVPAVRALHGATDGSGDVFSARRGSPAAALCLDATPAELLRQASGRLSAPASGRDPGGFPTDLQRGLLGPVEIPGMLLEVMAGIAVSFRLRGQPRVALLVDELDGSDAGGWHEGLAVAAARQAPLVVVLQGPSADGLGVHAEGVGHPEGRNRSGAPVFPVPMSQRAEGYGVQAHAVDGLDPRAVEKVTWQAVEAARSGRGPQLVQVSAAPRDPLDWLSETLVETGAVEATWIDEVGREAAAAVTEAWDRVRQEPEPGIDQICAGDARILRARWCRWEGAA